MWEPALGVGARSAGDRSGCGSPLAQATLSGRYAAIHLAAQATLSGRYAAIHLVCGRSRGDRAPTVSWPALKSQPESQYLR